MGFRQVRKTCKHLAKSKTCNKHKSQKHNFLGSTMAPCTSTGIPLIKGKFTPFRLILFLYRDDAPLDEEWKIFWKDFWRWQFVFFEMYRSAKVDNKWLEYYYETHCIPFPFAKRHQKSPKTNRIFTVSQGVPRSSAKRRKPVSRQAFATVQNPLRESL